MLRGLVFMFLTRSGLLRVIGRLMLDRRVPIGAKLIIPAAILYLISPLDFVPDVIPFAGWIDDILAIVISIALFLGAAPREVVWEHFRAGKPKSQTGGNPKSDKDVIDGSYRVIDEDEEPRK